MRWDYYDVAPSAVVVITIAIITASGARNARRTDANMFPRILRRRNPHKTWAPPFGQGWRQSGSPLSVSPFRAAIPDARRTDRTACGLPAAREASPRRALPGVDCTLAALLRSPLDRWYSSPSYRGVIP